jgi:hypothetical protein
MTNYRRIYEQAYGPIPTDADGRTYDIHHIDGDRSNNDLSNLIALSIRDHYDRHLQQGDWGACKKLAIKMKMSPEDISMLAKLNARKQVIEGTHPFLGGEVQRQNAQKQLASGTHLFQRRPDGSSLQTDRVNSGSHNLLAGKDRSRFKKWHHSDIERKKIGERTKKQLLEGNHPFHDKETLKRNGKASKGMLWWTDGLINRRAKECPGTDWHRGQTRSP